MEVDFAQLIPCVARNGDILFYQSMDSEFLRAFVDCREEAGDSARTLADHIQTLRMFCDFLVSVGDLPDNPARALEVPKLAQNERTGWLSIDEALRLLDAASSSAFPERDVSLLLILLLLGLRPQEVAGLRRMDVDVPGRKLRIEERAKTTKTFLPLTENLAEALDAYLRHPNSPSTPLSPLYLDGRGKALSGHTLNRFLSEMAERAGITRRITAYMCRHSAATLYFLGGATLVDVRDQLRHKHLRTTRRYVHLQDPLLEEGVRYREPEKLLGTWLRRTLRPTRGWSCTSSEMTEATPRSGRSLGSTLGHGVTRAE